MGNGISEQRKALIRTYMSQHPDATLKEVGSFLGVTKQRAYVLLKRLGIETRYQKRRQFIRESEAEILRCIAAGNTNKQIAAILGVSEWTIRSHVSSILVKFNTNNRVEAVKLAREQGLI
jgi:DNA-binding CsgD family transcriptional regulator